MCGFVGVISSRLGQQLERSLLDAALDVMESRGPDSVGYYEATEDSLSYLMAHRRLKIIDLSDAANQPFQIGQHVMVFNGEIYNYLELKHELEKADKVFTTSSDTEVLLRAYEYWGVACFDKLEGAFSVVILDRQAMTVVLARDRFGEKPIYFSCEQGVLAFGSTLDSVLSVIEHNKLPINLESMRRFIVMGLSIAPETSIAGIQKLVPGQVLCFSLPQMKASSISFGFQKSRFGSAHKSASFDISEFESLLVNSLEKRFRADLPVVLLLSGGIDSTYLACLAKCKLGLNFRAVTITDDLQDSAETQRAKKVCDILKIPHTLVRMDSTRLNGKVRSYLSSTDEISCDPAFPVLCELFSATPKDAVVFLTGDGADELFLSYSSYSLLIERHSCINHKYNFQKPIRMLAAWLPRFIFYHYLRSIDGNAGMKFRSIIESEFYRHGLGRSIPKEIENISDDIGGLYQYSILYELPEYLLYKTDRASMMYSKEARAPFLDSELFNYMLSRQWSSSFVGNKNQIISRINHFLGCDLKFTKRGMAAGGQRNYNVPVKEIFPTATMLSKGLSLLEKIMFFSQIFINPLTRYRLLAIREWVSNQ